MQLQIKADNGIQTSYNTLKILKQIKTQANISHQLFPKNEI